MRRHDLVNRIALSLIALLLAGAGGVGLTFSYGAMGTARQHGAVLIPDVRTFVADHRTWFWWAAGAVSVAVALLCVAWLRIQLRLPRPANDDLTRPDQHGETTVQGSAAAGALTADVEALRGVAAANARVWGDPDRPDVYLRVQLYDDAPFQELVGRIQDERVHRLRQALQVDSTDNHLDLRIAEPAGRAVL